MNTMPNIMMLMMIMKKKTTQFLIKTIKATRSGGPIFGYLEMNMLTLISHGIMLLFSCPHFTVLCSLLLKVFTVIKWSIVMRVCVCLCWIIIIYLFHAIRWLNHVISLFKPGLERIRQNWKNTNEPEKIKSKRGSGVN